MAKNDPASSLAKFCLVLEEYRRTPEGRVRGSEDLVQHFFPFDANGANDRLFHYLPKEVRGPILAAWKIRGAKAALADSDDKVQEVVHDALVAGDLGHEEFEEGVTAAALIGWTPYALWWQFWRKGALSERALSKAFTTAYDLGMFDAGWFFEHLEADGKKGTDVLADGLSKADLTDWMKKIHAGGDGSPRGLLAALGWEKIVRQTRAPILIGALDLFALETGLHHPLGTTEAPRSVGVGAAPAKIPPLDDIESTVVTSWTGIAPAGAQAALKPPLLPNIDNARAGAPSVTPAGGSPTAPSKLAAPSAAPASASDVLFAATTPGDGRGDGVTRSPDAKHGSTSSKKNR